MGNLFMVELTHGNSQASKISAGSGTRSLIPDYLSRFGNFAAASSVPLFAIKSRYRVATWQLATNFETASTFVSPWLCGSPRSSAGLFSGSQVAEYRLLPDEPRGWILEAGFEPAVSRC
jgi:hypothetical protein